MTAWTFDPCTDLPTRTEPERHDMTITAGELRGRTQPTILLRMTSSVKAAPGNTDGERDVFRAGMVVFAQYIGNGRLLLDPLDKSTGWAPQVVMASALNSTAEIVDQARLAAAFQTAPVQPLEGWQHITHDHGEDRTGARSRPDGS